MPVQQARLNLSCLRIFSMRSQPVDASRWAMIRRTAALAVTVVVFLSLSGCASQRLSRDPLCHEIALFANATKPGETHVVSLETAWGPSGKHPEVLSSADCNDGGFGPAARLCRYLVEHSATEFSDNNFRTAAACLSGIPAQTRNFVTYERLDVRISAYGAVGVRHDVELSLDFKPNEVNGTMQLMIGATALASDK